MPTFKIVKNYYEPKYSVEDLKNYLAAKKQHKKAQYDASPLKKCRKALDSALNRIIQKYGPASAIGTISQAFLNSKDSHTLTNLFRIKRGIEKKWNDNDKKTFQIVKEIVQCHEENLEIINLILDLEEKIPEGEETLILDVYSKDPLTLIDLSKIEEEYKQKYKQKGIEDYEEKFKPLKEIVECHIEKLNKIRKRHEVDTVIDNMISDLKEIKDTEDQKPIIAKICQNLINKARLSIGYEIENITSDILNCINKKEAKNNLANRDKFTQIKKIVATSLNQLVLIENRYENKRLPPISLNFEEPREARKQEEILNNGGRTQASARATRANVGTTQVNGETSPAKDEAEKQMRALLKNYLEEREKQRDETGKIREYIFDCRPFPTFFQKSYTEKKAAVEALISALDGKHVDLKQHLATLRNGNLGKSLRKFIHDGNADIIIYSPEEIENAKYETRSVSKFVEKLHNSVNKDEERLTI